jgi:hypothetical protein
VSALEASKSWLTYELVGAILGPLLIGALVLVPVVVL